MKELLQTLQSIRTALLEDRVTPVIEQAAANYARECAQAEQRLDQVAVMLRNGSDYQALQIAEQDPPLLDRAALLSFGEEKRWREFCEAHQMPIAASIDAATVRSLELLYTKGITANHPLYKDFRSAVLSRDDAKSLNIIRTILKLNPGDENARTELVRLQNKKYQETLEQLRSALKTDDEETISRLTEELPGLAANEKLERESAFQQGQAIRRSWRARQAGERLPGLIREMQEKRDADDWRGTGLILEEIRGLMQEHSIEPAEDGQKKQIETLAGYYEDRLAADTRRRGFERTLSGFLAFVDEVEMRLLSGGGMSYAELSHKDETFVRLWKELEACRQPVPNEALQKITRAGQELRSRLEARQRGKRARIWLGAGTVAGVLCVVIAVSLLAWKAHTLAEELAASQEKGNIQPAEELIRQLREEDAYLLHWPALQARVEEADAWAKEGRTLSAQVQKQMNDIEASFDGEFSSLPPSDLVRQLDELDGRIKQLPADLATEPKNRLAALRTRTDLQLTALASAHATGIALEVTNLEAMFPQALSYEKLSGLATANVPKLEAELAELEAALKPPLESLRLPAALESRILSLRQRLTAVQEELATLDKIRSAADEADSLTAYSKVLSQWQDIRFPDAAYASAVLDVMTDEKAFLAGLLTGGDKDLFQAILDDVSSVHMAPLEPFEKDLRILLELRDDKFLNNIWENTITDVARRQAARTVWSAGKLEEATIGDVQRWSGDCFDPSQGASSVVFSRQEFREVSFGGSNTGGQKVASSRLSATSALMNSLQLTRMTDADGERFLRSLLELFEIIVNDTQASPVAKAYLMISLENMANARPLAWGFHYSPTLQADFAELGRVLGDTRLSNEDWLLPAVREKLAAPLGRYFESVRDRHYLKEAKARRELLMSIAQAGVKFGGYVRMDLSMKLQGPARVAKELWVLSEDGGKPLLIANMDAGIGVAEELKTRAVGAMPLSPVFFIPVDRAALIQRYEDALAGEGKSAAPAAGGILFLAPAANE